MNNSELRPVTNDGDHDKQNEEGQTTDVAAFEPKTKKNATQSQSPVEETNLQNKSDNKSKAGDKSESPNLSGSLDKDDIGSLGSLSDADGCEGVLNSETWIEELECALLADCDPATLKKISDGRRIPANLRPDYWRTLLALNDGCRVKLSSDFDLENQAQLRQDCEKLVEDISNNLTTKPLPEGDIVKLTTQFESTLTTYVKARPELSYVPENGWTDILKVLYNLELSDTQLYQMFFRIVDRYIPKDLSTKYIVSQPQHGVISQSLNDTNGDRPSNANGQEKSASNQEDTSVKSKNESKSISSTQANIPSPATSKTTTTTVSSRSVQAYHLLRLLIQYHDPELCSILDSRKITPNMYVKDWFCSLFSRSCSPELALLIWDTHFRMADPFLIFFAAIVMVVNASDELKKPDMDQSKMLTVLKSMPSQLEEDDIEDLYYLVSNHYTNSTPRSIRCYSHLFFMDTFGNTYLGNESPEDGQPLLDLKTTQLTNSLDLSQYLCLPIVPAEIFTLDTAQFKISPTQSTSLLKYFLVDCRPAEQYNAGHLTRAFHLDCSLMLREPSSFATAVQALLEIQRQVVASKSNTGGRHLCFIGSGHEEEDQYVNMVVASFLQKYQKYVSIVVGGFEAIHDYVRTKSELKDSFNSYIVDHNEELCKACYSKSPDLFENFKAKRASLINSSSSGSLGNMASAQSLFASTTSFLRGEKASLSSGTFSKLTPGPQASATANLIAQSGASMFDKFTTAFVSRSSVIKDRLVETLNTTTIPTGTSLGAGASTGRGHVSSQDKLGKRYTGGNLRYAIDDNDVDDDLNMSGRGALMDGNSASETLQEIQLDTWRTQTKILAFYKCAQIKGTTRYPGYVALDKTHLWILREIPHNKGFASIAAKRPLDMIVQITSKRRQPNLIIFRYGYANHNNAKIRPDATGNSPVNDDADASTKSSKTLPSIVASDQLHIPQAFEMIRLIKREIVRIMDESSRGATNPDPVASNAKAAPPDTAAETKSLEDKDNQESSKTTQVSNRSTVDSIKDKSINK